MTVLLACVIISFGTMVVLAALAVFEMDRADWLEQRRDHL